MEKEEKNKLAEWAKSEEGKEALERAHKQSTAAIKAIEKNLERDPLDSLDVYNEAA